MPNISETPVEKALRIICEYVPKPQQKHFQIKARHVLEDWRDEEKEERDGKSI